MLHLAIMVSCLVPASAPQTTVVTLDLRKVKTAQMVQLKRALWRVRGVWKATLDLQTETLIIRHSRRMSATALHWAIEKSKIPVVHAELEGQLCQDDGRLACVASPQRYAQRRLRATQSATTPRPPHQR